MQLPLHLPPVLDRDPLRIPLLARGLDFTNELMAHAQPVRCAKVMLVLIMPNNPIVRHNPVRLFQPHRDWAFPSTTTRHIRVVLLHPISTVILHSPLKPARARSSTSHLRSRHTLPAGRQPPFSRNPFRGNKPVNVNHFF